MTLSTQWTILCPTTAVPSSSPCLRLRLCKPEDCDLPDCVREQRLMLHSVTTCKTVAPVINWYHATAIRICPTTELASSIVHAQCGDALWSSERFLECETACVPFLHHLVLPTDVCSHEL